MALEMVGDRSRPLSVLFANQSGAKMNSYRGKVQFCVRQLAPALCLTILTLWAQPGVRAQATEVREGGTVEIDAAAPSHPFPHFWEQMFGSGRAILSLRESYRHDLQETKRITDFEFIRFHAIFHDEVGLYSGDYDGKPVYNFSYVDQIYDGLLQNGVRPFVGLSFMPQKLAAPQTAQSFWYHPIVSPPKDLSKWGDLISHFAQHLVDRYGIDEVSHWYFEVWNEPNLAFWAGEPKEQTYWTLYDHTARTLKAVDPRLRVGGPATARSEEHT